MHPKMILGISHNTEIRCRKTSQKQSVLQKIQPLNQVAEHEYKVNQQNLEVFIGDQVVFIQ